MTDYEKFKDAITKKYGKPNIDEVAWENASDQQYYADKLDNALKLGRVKYQACWETERTHIELILGSENYNIGLVVRYKNKVFSDTEPDYSEDF